jgi:DNA-binding MarR family transcriptional regulator
MIEDSGQPAQAGELTEAWPHSARLNLGALPSLLGFHIRLAYVAIFRDYAATVGDLDLTQKQAAILHLINANPGVSQVDLAGTLGADRATMMAMIDRLEGRRLIRRQRSSEDRRRQELHLTDAGKILLRQIDDVVRKHEKRFTERFTDEELAAFIDALKRVHQRI